MPNWRRCAIRRATAGMCPSSAIWTRRAIGEHARRVEFLQALCREAGRAGNPNLVPRQRGHDGSRATRASSRRAASICRRSRPATRAPSRAGACPSAATACPPAADSCCPTGAGMRPEDFARRRARRVRRPRRLRRARSGISSSTSSEARAIAERARARVARDHGYRNRAARLLDCARHGRCCGQGRRARAHPDPAPRQHRRPRLHDAADRRAARAAAAAPGWARW